MSVRLRRRDNQGSRGKLQGLSRLVVIGLIPPLLTLRLLELICNLIQLLLHRAGGSGPTGGLMFPLPAVEGGGVS